MPADLKLQIPVIRRFVDALGIPSLSTPGFEADDILATIGARSRRAAAPVTSSPATRIAAN